ncbi:2-dehydro-3-deoxy-6-phosphogalactonate aldolase [Nocardia sp. NPDC088792]|uniref:2-dehydro-3-deoxy-6-phosphogalactonate aldolase n=1 Tax=Nocardia sp. NPDC088792 TaxID=3364332 RepID=UPI00381628ED
MTDTATTSSGLVAILRGITPDEVAAIGTVLAEEGFGAVEVPLNSPQPFHSIERLAAAIGEVCVVGAGTVLNADDVARAHTAGARIIVSPDTHIEVITAAIERGLRPYPGVATPTEAFAAIRAGARSLKLFPSHLLGITGMRALRAVLPAEVELLPVGGIDEDNIGAWAAAGAGGAGVGTSVYRPGDSADAVRARARKLCAAWSSVTA